MDNKNRTVVITLMFFIIVCVLWLAGVHAYAKAYSVKAASTQGDISKQSQKQTLEATQKIIAVMDKYITIDDIDIFVSTHTFKNEKVDAKFIVKDGKCSIIIASHFVSFQDTCAIVLHELGHYFVYKQNINMYDYSQFMYGNKNSIKSRLWKANKQEDYCEEFCRFFMNKAFFLSHTKLTKYKTNPNQFELYFDNGGDI